MALHEVWVLVFDWSLIFALVIVLVEKRGEPCVHQSRRVALIWPLRLLVAVSLLVISWAAPRVDWFDRLRRTVNRFREDPYVFFTESDFHAYLYHCLYSRKIQARARDGVLTTCVHREYPTSFRYSKETMEDYGFEGRGDRGNYDLVVLNPEFIRENDVKSVVNKDVRDAVGRRERDDARFRRELVAAIEFKYVVNNSLGFVQSVEKGSVKLSHGRRYQGFEAYNLVFCNLKYRYLQELTRKIKILRAENPVKNLLAISYFEESKKVTPRPITNGWRI